MGELIGYFIGAGVVIAVITSIIKWLLTRIGWPKNEQWRALIACLIPTALSLLAADQLSVAIIHLMAGIIVLGGYMLRSPKSKKMDTKHCDQCGHSILEKQKFCTRCGAEIDRATPSPISGMTERSLAKKAEEKMAQTPEGGIASGPATTVGKAFYSWVLVNKNTIIIIGLAMITVFFVYWVLFRPAFVRNGCQNSPYYGSANRLSPYSATYENCLHANGLKD